MHEGDEHSEIVSKTFVVDANNEDEITDSEYPSLPRFLRFLCSWNCLNLKHSG